MILPSDRDNMNTERLTRNWRPIWTYMFQEFKDTLYKSFSIHGNQLNEYKIKGKAQGSSLIFNGEESSGLIYSTKTQLYIKEL